MGGDPPMAEAVVIVNGFPIATPQIGMDQVPLIDATTAGILAAVNNFKIRQRTSLMEGITGGCIEKENMYDVFDAANGVHLFTVMEKSESSERCCCAPNHSLFLEFKGVAGMGDMSKAPRAQFAGLPTVMWAEREGCCSKWGLGCCICDASCANEMFMHAGTPAPGITAGKTAWAGQGLIGYLAQPSPWGGGFTPTVNIMERANPADTSVRPLSKVEGPCIFGGCSELCCDSNWMVSQMQPHQFNSGVGTGDLARIVKTRPTSAGAAIREAFTDSDSYSMDFVPGNNLAPQQKAIMMASLILVDYMFFEQDNGMCKIEDQKIKITVFQYYCMGTTCPCNIVIPLNQGGAPAKSEEMTR